MKVELQHRAHIGQHGDTSALIFLVGGSVLVSLILIVTYGSVFSTLAVIGMIATVVLTFYRLDWGFFLFVGMVLAFDQFPPRGYETSIIGVEYFQNLKAFPFLASVDMAVVTPMELHLFLIITVWFMLIIMGKKVLLQGVPVWFPALLFFFWLTMAMIYGMGRGGDFLPALWELRALFYLGVMYFFIPQVIQTRTQLQSFIWVCISAVAFKAFQGIIRLVRMGFQFGDRTELTNHEDPLFFIALFILLFGLAFFGGNNKQKRVLAWLLLPLSAVFVLAQRRATYGALGIALIAFIVILPKKERWMMMRIILPGLVLFGIYLAAFWNTQSTVGYPAQLVKSSFSTEQEMTGDRYYSNLYRKFENYNLAATVQKSPLIGIGFGNKYDQPVSLAAIPFSLRDYIPHNEIFWLIVKMGVVGFFFFWFFFDTYLFHAASIYGGLQDPYLKSVCAISIIAVVGQIMVSYFDLQLTFYRNMVFLGVFMGLLPTLKLLDKSTAKESTSVIKAPQFPFAR